MNLMLFPVQWRTYSIWSLCRSALFLSRHFARLVYDFFNNQIKVTILYYSQRKYYVIMFTVWTSYLVSSQVFIHYTVREISLLMLTNSTMIYIMIMDDTKCLQTVHSLQETGYCLTLFLRWCLAATLVK